MEEKQKLKIPETISNFALIKTLCLMCSEFQDACVISAENKAFSDMIEDRLLNNQEVSDEDMELYASIQQGYIESCIRITNAEDDLPF